MIAMQLMNPDRLRRAPTHPTAAAGREGARAGGRPADEPAKIIAVFRPLDPGIVSDTIPAFFIGRNMEGFWIARDANGQIGGIFLLQTSALSFARRNSPLTGCATIFPSERFELDLENRGNLLVPQLGPLIRFAQRQRRRMAASMARMTEAVKRRLGGFHVPWA
jgi:hypothetical protein